MIHAARHSSGFTLTDMVVVLVILSILAVLVVPKVMSRPDDARVTAAKSDINAIAGALELYRFDNYRYPTTEEGLQALVTRPAGDDTPNWKPGGYLKAVPLDPWGHPYQYRQPGEIGAYDLFSYGADGKPVGEGYNKEIGNWE